MQAQTAEDAFAADAKAFHELRVGRVVEETHDTRSFALEIPARLQRTFGYRAGQFLTFKVAHEGKELTRCYSLSSSPDTDSELRFTVKRVQDGRVSNWFNDQVVVGTALRVLAPAGRFVLKDHQTPVVLFGGGSGITPLFSILKTVLHTTQRQARLVYANRDPKSVIFAEELGALQRAFPQRFEVVHNLDSEHGWLSAERLRELSADRLNADCYICGPGPFMDLAERVLLDLSLPREHLFVERFVSPSDPAAQPARPSPQATASPEHIRARWDGKLHLVPYTAGQTLLQAAVAAGVDPPYSCEEGYCSSCQAKLTRGEVSMAVNDCLSDDEVRDGCILACQAYPLTDDIEIDWDA